jgi:acetolactate synthase-1/2/3 large subunit
VIALGTRLRDADSKRRGVRIGSLVHVDIDDRWLGKNYCPLLAAAADMGRAVDALERAMAGRRSAWDMESLKKAREAELARLERGHEGFRIISLLRRAIPRDSVTVWDLTLCGYWAEYYFPVFEERTFLFPRGISPIFYAFPAAIGAKLGRDDRPVLCVTGDGSFLPTAAELAFVGAHNLPVVVLVYDNGGFGVLEDYMKKRYGEGGSMALTNPDFPALARSFGIKAARAGNLEELERIFRRSVTWDEPYVIDFRYPLFPPPWG